MAIVRWPKLKSADTANILSMLHHSTVANYHSITAIATQPFTVSSHCHLTLHYHHNTHYHFAVNLTLELDATSPLYHQLDTATRHYTAILLYIVLVNISCHLATLQLVNASWSTLADASTGQQLHLVNILLIDNILRNNVQSDHHNSSKTSPD